MNFLRIILAMVGLSLLFSSPAMAGQASQPLSAGSHHLSVMDDTHIGIGVYPNTEAGKTACFAALDAGTVIFYKPTDTRHFDASLAHRPLEVSTCGQLIVAVNHGAVGIVAFKEGTEFNTATIGGKVEVVALRECNNWTNLFYRDRVEPLSKPAQIVRTEVQQTIVQAPEVKARVETPAPKNQVVEYDAGTIIYVPRYRVVVERPQVEERVYQPTFRAPVYKYTEQTEQEDQCVCLDNPRNEIVRQVPVRKMWRGLRPGLYCMPNSLALQYYGVNHWSDE